MTYTENRALYLDRLERRLKARLAFMERATPISPLGDSYKLHRIDLARNALTKVYRMQRKLDEQHTGN